MRMESVGKSGVRLLGLMMILILSWLVGALLLFAVYVLPTEPMKENVARGTEVYNSEGNFPELAAGYRSTKLY